jgi:hypothetical protein
VISQGLRQDDAIRFWRWRRGAVLLRYAARLSLFLVESDIAPQHSGAFSPWNQKRPDREWGVIPNRESKPSAGRMAS